MDYKLILSATEKYELTALPNTYEELRQIIESKLPQQSTSFRLKYKDGEEELITLNCEEDFQTAIVTCKIENLNSLEIHVFKDEVNQSMVSEKAILKCNEVLQRGFHCNQFQRYSLPQTRKVSTDINQTYDFGETLNRSMNRKSESPNEKKPAYKVQFKSKFEHKTLQVIMGETYTYSFTLKNCGEIQWPDKIQLVCVNGIHKKQTKTVPSLKPGEQIEMGLILAASEQVGKQLSQWRLHYDEDSTFKGFGRTFFIEINSVKRQAEEIEVIEKPRKKETLMINKPCSVESEDYSRILQLGEALDDMFPGDLKGKVKFVESCPNHFSIYDLVDNYLLSLRGDNTKFSQNIIFA